MKMRQPQQHSTRRRSGVGDISRGPSSSTGPSGRAAPAGCRRRASGRSPLRMVLLVPAFRLGLRPWLRAARRAWPLESTLHFCLAQRLGCTGAVDFQLLWRISRQRPGSFVDRESILGSTTHAFGFCARQKQTSLRAVLSSRLRSIVPRRFEPTSLRAFAAESLSGR